MVDAAIKGDLLVDALLPQLEATSASATIRTSLTAKFYYYLCISNASSRRFFLGTLTGLVAARPLAAQTPARASAAATTRDLAWLDEFKGKHKQVFDLGSFGLAEDSPLRLPNNYLNMFRDVYHLDPPDVNVAVGIARTAFPLNASDALWEKYKIGEHWKIKGTDGKPAARNIYLGAESGGPGSSIRALVGRGVVFWQCNIAIMGISNQFAEQTGEPLEKVRAEVVKGLNPWVKVVPAHSMAVGLVQERGFTYMRP